MSSRTRLNSCSGEPVARGPAAAEPDPLAERHVSIPVLVNLRLGVTSDVSTKGYFYRSQFLFW